MLDLMRVLEAKGDRAEALLAYDAFVARFKADLEAEPSTQLRAAADRIRHSRSGPVQAPPPARPALPFQPGRAGASGSAEHALRLVRGDEADEPAPAPQPEVGLAPSSAVAPVSTKLPPGSPWRRAAPWLLSAAALVALGWLAADRGSAALAPTVRFTLTIPIQLPPAEYGPAIALSADGATLVYVGWNHGRPQLFVRRLDEATPRLLAGTEDGQAPFFSPDGQWIGYWAHGELRKVPVAGGVSTPLLNVWWVVGATWLTDSSIVIGRTPTDSLLALVSAAGGAPRPLRASPPSAEMPIAIPGGKVLLLRDYGQTIYLMAAGDSAATSLGVKGHPVGLLDNAMVYVRSHGVLMAFPVDVDRRRATGPPVALLDGDLVLSAALAADGTLVYIRRTRGDRAILVDLAGGETPLMTDSGGLGFPAASPDGKKIAFQTESPPGRGISVYDIPSKTLSQLTVASGERPAWSGDGKWVGFTAGRPMRIAADGSGITDTLSDIISPLDAGIREVTFSPDGRYAVIRNDAHITKRDLWLIPLGPHGARGAPVPLRVTPANELMPRVSPDSRHVVFVSDASGQDEVYVQPFPESGPLLQVSSGGGTEPVWAPDGRGIFYRANGKMMVATLSSEAPLRVLNRRILFDDTYLSSEVHQEYGVMPDGRHLVMLKPLQPTGDEGQSVIVVQGWVRELRQQLAPGPAKK